MLRGRLWGIWPCAGHSWSAVDQFHSIDRRLHNDCAFISSRRSIPTISSSPWTAGLAKDARTAPQLQPGAIPHDDPQTRASARVRLAGLAIEFGQRRGSLSGGGTAFVISLRRRGHVRPIFHLYAGDELVTAVLWPEDRSFALSDVEPILAERVDDIRLVRN